MIDQTMKKIIAMFAVAGVAVALNAAAADGAALYKKECAKCHGADGKGQTAMGKKMSAKDYTDPKVQDAMTDEAAAKAIKDGFKDKGGKVLMKPMPELTDAEVKAMVKHMRTFRKK
jgi:mono/diheme cytochrome c family protein